MYGCFFARPNHSKTIHPGKHIWVSEHFLSPPVNPSTTHPTGQTFSNPSYPPQVTSYLLLPQLDDAWHLGQEQAPPAPLALQIPDKPTLNLSIPRIFTSPNLDAYVSPYPSHLPTSYPSSAPPTTITSATSQTYPLLSTSPPPGSANPPPPSHAPTSPLHPHPTPFKSPMQYLCTLFPSKSLELKFVCSITPYTLFYPRYQHDNCRHLSPPQWRKRAESNSSLSLPLSSGGIQRETFVRGDRRG